MKGRNHEMLEAAIASGLTIDDEGRIILPSGKVAKTSKCRAGYFVISLGPVDARRSFTVARVICWLRHGPPPSSTHQVDHINRDRSDDRPENLRWATASENALNVSDESKNRMRQSMIRNRRETFGSIHHFAKLTTAQVEEIKTCKMPQRKIAQMFGVRQSTVSKIKTGSQRRRG